MNCKKSMAPFLLLTVFILTIASTAVAQSTNEEKDMRNVYSINRYGLVVNIDAPYQADPGKNISITVRTEAHGDIEGLYIEYIYLKIYGLVNETNEILLGNFTHLENSTLDFQQVYERSHTIIISNETSPGLIYGRIWCKWKCVSVGVEGEISNAGFVVTYIKNKEYEKLYEDYQELNSTYWSLHDNYTNLESNYLGELGNTRNMMYVFVVTTVVSAASAVFFVIRRPKKWW